MRIGADSATMAFPDVRLETIAARLNALRAPDSATPPAVSVVIPVNAKGDLRNVLRVLSDLAAYTGPHTVEVVLVVNNFADDQPPAEIDEFNRLGARVVAVPSVRKPGEAVGFTARIHGVRAAASPHVVLLDADCRVPDATALLDWYVEQFQKGAAAAYTHVAYYEFSDAVSIRVRFLLHHASRWIKRTVLRTPTTRGSNYGVRRETILDLYEQGRLADEMNVGPAFRRLAGRVAYSGDRRLTVYTSGRMFRPGWRRVAPYFVYRLKYNLRVLPVRAGVAGRTGRERDPERRYDEHNRPMRT